MIPWHEKTWCIPPAADAEFVARMEDLLELYQVPYDARRPVVCMDELCKQLIAETRVGPYAAVVPVISGQAWITGFANYVIEEDDPFPTGYTVGDIWSASS